MATTEQRSGFRLPWTSEPRSTAEPPETEQSVHESDHAQPTTASADSEAPGSATRSKDSSTTAALDGVDHPSTESDIVSPETATATATASTAAIPTATKRPTKFLADLTRAMQAAAEEARTQAVSQLESEAKAYVESIHSESSGQASELRKRADDDVASIREWSKAELAHVREATEGRITARKLELEAQLQRHAGVIEQEIERVKGQVGKFESEMTTFFEGLLAEQDPTRFAALAESLPEPPPFGSIAMDLDELLASATYASTNGTGVPATLGMTAAAVAPAEPITEAPEAAMVDGSATGSDMSGDDALASIRAAVDAASHAEADAARAEVAAERAEAAAETTEHHGPDSDGGEARSEASATGESATEATATGAEAEAESEAGAAEASGDAGNIIGVETPDAAAAAAAAAETRAQGAGPDDFDAAEAAAVAGAADDDEIPTIDDAALSARLDGLMPARTNNAKSASTEVSGESRITQVVVVGLVSVASIASFKRHLGRIAHVSSVGVSSGPDGEFVFAVAHDGDVSLREVVATLPGFQARVTNAGDGIVNVTAHDPESEG